MIILNEITIEEFKLTIYNQYLTIFPEDERKSLQTIESLVEKKIMKLIKITNKNLLIGFMIINKIDGNNYIQLDYFAILPQYQNKGYGTKSINLLKEKYHKYNGIFVEVEKEESKMSKEDNKIRKRRVDFYKKLGFNQLNYEFKWFNTLVLIPYFLPISYNQDSNESIFNNIINLYSKTHGNQKIRENLQITKY